MGGKLEGRKGRGQNLEDTFEDGLVEEENDSEDENDIEEIVSRNITDNISKGFLGDRAINNAEYSCFVTIININKHLKCDLVFLIINALIIRAST